MRYITDTLDHRDEAGYHVEDGIVTDDTEDYRPTGRKTGELTRTAHVQTDLERRIEEANWAARSGPVTIRRKAS